MELHCTRDMQEGNTVNHTEKTEKTSKGFPSWSVEALTAMIIVMTINKEAEST